MNVTKRVGLDIGRGHVKVKTANKSFMFSSTIAPSEELGIDGDQSRIDLSINGENHFVGAYAEDKKTSIQYSSESKTDEVAQVLFWTALHEAFKGQGHVRVKVVLGVPYAIYTRDTLNEVMETYLHKSLTITDNVNEVKTTIEVADIQIFSEANAVARFLVEKNPELEEIDFGIANFGYRTFEYAYFEPGIKYIEELSDTEEFGNLDILDDARKASGSKLPLRKFDSIKVEKYVEAKKKAYKKGLQKAQQMIMQNWRHQYDYMKIFIAGGTGLNLNFEVDEKTNYVPQAQHACANGLYLMAMDLFKED